MTNQSARFDPAAHITKPGGRDYLEVKWRLAWLRDVQPDAVVETQLERYDDDGGFALFKAKVTLPSGGEATGWGSETQGDFGDFIEKAETKALGRALAALGFGTQFCDDFSEGGSVADSPVQRPAPKRAAPAGNVPAATQAPSGAADPTSKLWALLYKIYPREGEGNRGEMLDFIQNKFSWLVTGEGDKRHVDFKKLSPEELASFTADLEAIA